jgi:broad specificity phosphatase PhoE
MSVVYISLIRHAQSEANICSKNLVGGHNLAVPLTKEGIKQAIALGKYIKQENIIFTQAYSSTAKRTQNTAEYCFREMGCMLPIITDENLLEQNQGDWEGQSRNIYNRPDVRYALDTNNWEFTPGDNRKGESQKAVALRMKNWIEEKLKKCSPGEYHHIVIFTHGSSIKFLCAELLNFERSTAYSDVNPIDNTSVTQLCYRNDELQLPLIKRNDVTHLQKCGAF